MAHEIRENDSMFSVREKPWHGLGNILPQTPSIEGAITASGLDWKAALKEMVVPMADNEGNFYQLEVPNHNAIIRTDINKVLGIVGNRYQIYQNSEMWSFIDEFQQQSGIKLETAGSLRNGRTTWVLAKNGTMEAISGDPIEEYFLFKNSFDGSSPISCMFTNIRVVCNNTLSAALKGSKNIFNVRHTGSAEGKIKDVQKALGVRSKYQEKMKEAMEYLVNFKMTSTDTENYITQVLFPEKEEAIETQSETVNGILGMVNINPVSKSGQTGRLNKINKLLELVETGAGTNIPGVKGTGYGVWNAVTEWADHDKTVRITQNRDEAEVKFENAFFGSGAAFKTNSFNQLMKLAS